MAKRILVIDDEKDIIEILQAILQHEGYDVITAYDGEEGLRKVAEQKPDLIVTDIMMPKIDGFAFTQKVKEDPDTCDIPVVMLTAKDQDVDKYKGLSLGVAAYIVKLFDLEELREVIKELLEKNNQ